MNRGGVLLAGVVAGAWALLYLATQLTANPPLSTGRTIVVGVLASALLIVGYPSVLRGPRHGFVGSSTLGRRRRSERSPLSAPMAVMGRPIPLRSGLTPEAAERTVRVLREIVGGDSIAITDRSRVLAFVGAGSDHHKTDAAPITAATGEVLRTGRTLVLDRPERVGCPSPGCPLRTATIAPLRIGERIVGALKVYRLGDDPPPVGVVDGLASILSLHLELAELDRERQLAADAQLDALRAQINPHFLFNTLNTIAAKLRSDPEEARRLLLRLSDFFRYSIRQEGHFADFAQEYFFVRTYLALEQARYGDRLAARYDVDPQVLATQVPVLVIQPLVENAVKHGLAEQVDGGTVALRARVDPLARTTNIQVADDGVGMSEETLRRVVAGEAPSGGIGLRNISERLARLFGGGYSLDVRSTQGVGTVVDVRMPLR